MTEKKPGDLMHEDRVYTKYPDLFADRELREARKAGEIRWFDLRKGPHYTDAQIMEYLESQERKLCHQPNEKLDPAREKSERLFQIGAYWLGHEKGSEYLFYYWYDAAARRTRRKGTGIRDLEEAKTWLAKLVLAEPPEDPQHVDNVTLASVRLFYFKRHVNAKVGDRDRVRDKRSPKRAFALLMVYLVNMMRADGLDGAPKVGHFTLARQEGFMKWCAQKHNLTGKTISTYLSYIKAAMRFAAKPRLVRDARGREREAQLLSVAPHIEDNEERVCVVTDLPRSTPRAYVPTDAELAAIIDALPEGPEHEAAFRYIVMALNTWARPEAICQLSTKTQVDFERGLVTLNPPGRTQNKKKRPTIKLTDNLRGWLLYWNLDRPIVYFGRPVSKIDNRTLKLAAERAGIDPAKVNRYMLRHYMANRVRRVEGIEVSREERATWMGHTDQDFKTTQAWYEHLDPDYLANVARAIDAVMVRLQQLCKRTLFSPNLRPSTGLVLLKNQAS